MKEDKPIYPIVEVKDVLVQTRDSEYVSLTFSTTLRKEHNGKWFLWPFFKTWRLDVADEKSKIELLQKFHLDVYFTIVLGVVSEDAVDSFGNKTFEEDEVQISEKERIKQLLMP